MATFLSRLHYASRARIVAAALVFFAGVNAGWAGDNKIYAVRAQEAFRVAQTNFLAATNNVTNAWNFARTCYDAATFATNDSQKADFARLGTAAVQPLLQAEPKSAPLRYYLAMNFGELADAQAPSLASFHLVHDMEHEFKIADDLDAKFDFAGPARNLGELYLQAPGWPMSLGNNRKAREFLERAATLAPEYPENILNLAEAELKWRDRPAAQKTLQQLENFWPAAQTNFTGAAWEQSEDDWRARREKARDEFKKVFKTAP